MAKDKIPNPTTASVPVGAPEPQVKVPDIPQTPVSSGGNPIHAETPEAAAAEVAAAAPKPNTEAMAAANKRAETSEPQVIKNKGGRPKGIPAANSKLVVLEREKATEAELKAKCRRAGRGAADAFMLIGRTLGGPEWAPDAPRDINGQTLDEAENLRQAWAETYEFYGWCNTPGWFPMVFSGITYCAVRLNRPETAKRVLTWKEKVAAWWAKRAVRAMNQPAPPPVKQDKSEGN